MEDLAEILAKNLRDRRHALKLTQSELAAKVGLSPRAIQQFEYRLRWPSSENLARLADELKLKVADLLQSDSPLPSQKLEAPTPRQALQTLVEYFSEYERWKEASPEAKELFNLLGGLDEAQVSVLLDHARGFAAQSSVKESAQDRLKRKQAR